MDIPTLWVAQHLSHLSLFRPFMLSSVVPGAGFANCIVLIPLSFQFLLVSANGRHCPLTRLWSCFLWKWQWQQQEQSWAFWSQLRWYGFNNSSHRSSVTWGEECGVLAPVVALQAPCFHLINRGYGILSWRVMVAAAVSTSVRAALGGSPHGFQVILVFSLTSSLRSGSRLLALFIWIILPFFSVSQPFPYFVIYFLY